MTNKHKTYAVNIQWDIDMPYIMETVDCFSDEFASEILNVDKGAYAKMSHEDREKLVKTFCDTQPNPLEKLLKLPSKVEIPEDVKNEDISDWLTDYYEACHSGFEVITE